MILAGLEKVELPARWQRFEVGGRVVILDSTHNAEGASALDTNLRVLTRDYGRLPIIVSGVLGLNRARPLVDVLCEHGREIHFVEPQQRRACSIKELTALVPRSWGGRVVPDTVQRVFPSSDMCAIGSPGDVVVVTGSIYLAGEVLAQIQPHRGPYEGHLQDF
jgi:dihydrofolate synthase/folylpolyglutamate synthase